MTDLTDKQSRLAAVKKSRDTGVLTVRHGDQQTTFRSMAEIESIIAALEREIAGLQGTAVRGPRYIYQSGKGL
jgi:hypothetical protein